MLRGQAQWSRSGLQVVMSGDLFQLPRFLAPGRELTSFLPQMVAMRERYERAAHPRDSCESLVA